MYRKDENGEIMLESLIVYSVTIFLLFFILAIFSVLFQRWNLQTIANETAARMAQTYRFIEADEVTGYVTDKEIKAVREYRYLWKSNELETYTLKKATSYAGWRLDQSTYTKNVTEPKYQIEVISDSLARRHLKLTITGEYAVPFGEALSYFGFDSTTKYEVTAYAECLDIIDYVNTVNYVEDQLSFGQFNSKFVKMLNKILGLFKNLLE